MAVPKRKTSVSKRNMRRSHDSLKNINVILKPFMGVTLSKGTVCNLNFPKNSLVMQLETDDVDFDIEKKTDETI